MKIFIVDMDYFEVFVVFDVVLIFVEFIFFGFVGCLMVGVVFVVENCGI